MNLFIGIYISASTKLLKNFRFIYICNMEAFKRTLILPLVLLVAGTAFGQTINDHVTLSVDKFDGIYSKGEAVRIYAQADSAATYRLKLYVNGLAKSESQVEIGLEKSVIFNESYDGPIALMFEVKGMDSASKGNAMIGTIVAPEEFTPGFEEPRDLRKFWRKQFRRMRKSEPEVTLTKVPVTKPEYASNTLCYDLEISMPEGRPVRGYVAIPKGAEPGSLPIVIFAHAAGKIHNKWTLSDPDVTAALAHRGGGAIALDINAHGLLNGQPESYYKGFEDGELHDYSGRHVTSHEDFYFRTMFLRLERALDYACTSKYWDRKRVLVFGESQGGAQSAFLAGVDKRVGAAVMTVPAMMDMGGALKGRLSAWVKPLERDGLDSPARNIAPYYDGALLLKGCKASLFIEAGLIDVTCPPAGVFSGYNNAKGKKVMYTCPYRPHHEPNSKYHDGWMYIYEARNAFIDDYLK